MFTRLRLLRVQAGDATVTIDSIRAAFKTLGMSKEANTSIDYLVDEGYEETVPAATLVKLLRGAGLDTQVALDVKKLAMKNASLTLEPVSRVA